MYKYNRPPARRDPLRRARRLLKQYERLALHRLRSWDDPLADYIRRVIELEAAELAALEAEFGHRGDSNMI